MSRRYLGAVKLPEAAPLGVCCLVVFTLVLSLGIASASAHEGHDHGPPAAASTAPARPRLAVSSETYELVGVLEGERLTIYLDRFEDDSPVTDADITVTVNEEPAAAAPSGSGTYTVSSNRFSGRGLVELVFDVRAPGGDDLLIGKLTLAGSPTTAAPGAISPDSLPWYGRIWSHARHGAEDHLVLLTLTLLAGLAAGRGMRRRRRRPGKVLVFLLATAAMATIGMDRVASAHEGDHGAQSRPAVTGDAARRLPNGQVFVPKPTQRILDVRTVIARSETHPKTAVFVGRIITDPNRSGIIQSVTGGRVVASERGLPRIGQTIAKGDLLAFVEPPMPIADRTTISERAGELEQLIAIAEGKLKRLRPLAERSVVPQSQVIDQEAELDGLYRRRDVVRETRVAPEALRAPVGGVLAVSRVVAGQVVQAQDILFQIIDPSSLWVEAYDHGNGDPGSLKLATAIGPANAPMQLMFQGWSRTLQQQATVLQFSIAAPPPSIRVGQPVTVTAQLGDTVQGIVLDRDAVVRGNNGESIVWRHVEPELFEARPVRSEPFDATRVLLVAGVGEGDRIVVRGAGLIDQIR